MSGFTDQRARSPWEGLLDRASHRIRNKFLVAGLSGLVICAADLELSEAFPVSNGFVCEHEDAVACKVTDALGGNVVAHLARAREMIKQGQKLEINGMCVSACTMVADMLASHGLVCMHARATLVLHEPFVEFGGRRYAVFIEPYHYDTLGPFIEAHGGLKLNSFMLIDAREGLLPICPEATQRRI